MASNRAIIQLLDGFFNQPRKLYRDRMCAKATIVAQHINDSVLERFVNFRQTRNNGRNELDRVTESALEEVTGAKAFSIIKIFCG
jgi:hypothetical protein